MDPADSAPAPARRRTALRLALALALGIALAVPAALWTLLRSEAGSAWLLQRLPGLSVEGLRGALLGPDLGVQRLRWHGEAGSLELRGVALAGLRLQWRPQAGVWLALGADGLEVQQLHWQAGPTSSSAAAPAPESLRLPLAVQMPLHIARLQIGASSVLEGVQGTLALGAEGGALHRIDGLRLRWAGGQASAALRLHTDAPLTVALQAELVSLPAADKPWRAQLQLDGPLAAPALHGQLSGLDDAARAELQARLTPFAAFPLAALRLHTQALDLSRLHPRWPLTRIGGEAELVEPAADRPLQARVALRNERPGRWNEGRLPWRQARLDLRATLDAPDRLELPAFSLTLADADGDAGQLSGSGQWQGHVLTLELQATGVVPQRLDGRAPTWPLDAALGLELQGLPDPRGTAADQPWQAVAALAIHGRQADLAAPVFVQAQLRSSAELLAVERLLARAGAAELRASGAARSSGGGWAVKASAALQDFDPAPWWPGLGAGWRRGAQQLNASLALDLQLPQHGDWRRIAGTAQLDLADSQLAGVPVAGQAALGADGRLTLALDAGGNRIDAALSPDRRGDGSDDQAAFSLDAPSFAALAAWRGLHPSLGALPSAGRLQASGTLRGRWPALQGDASAQASGIVADALRIDQASAQWRSDASGDGTLQAQASHLRWQAQSLSHAELRLQGSPQRHRLQFDAASPLLPPAALARSLALSGGAGTRLTAALDGALQHTGDGWHWSARLQRLDAAPWDGRWPGAAGAAAPAWLQLPPLQAELAFDDDGRLQRLRADAGRLSLAGGIVLAWDELHFDGTTLRGQARLEDLALAPLLARWQPEMGWEGDLQVGARLQLAIGERTRIDAVFERMGGDLVVRESPERRMALGLSDLRLALQAEDGVWTFTQALAGQTLGDLGGVLRVQAPPASRWPGADDPLDGSLVGHVANLGIWAAWVPPGWRLQGSVASELHFGGRLGAPELRGSFDGDALGVRNLLQGVHVRDGEIRLRLDGGQAQVERFVLHGGDGRLELSGTAALGAQPHAELKLRAERFQLLSRIDRRLVTSGQATLALAAQTLALRGSFAIDEGLFDASRADAPALDEDVVIRRADDPAPAAEPAGAAASSRRTEVAVDIDLGPQLRVRGRGLDTRLAGRLRISAPRGRLAVHGTVNTVDGSYAAYAQKLRIERGDLVFSGEPGNPRMDVLALRPNLDIEVGVAITGSVQSPRVRLYSNPELSETDKLSWLVLGRDPGELGRNDTALLQRAAMALLAGEGEAPSDSLLRNLGIDEFSVRQDESGSGTRETIVSLGKQISQRWYLGYERGVNATVGTWQLIYRAAQRFTLRAQSGAENALDAIWIWRVP